ncbi:hypothetical protein NEBULOUS_27 [Microbacterium phage Nebulous]|nr:hypothetical protein NEBULOUS_27 [Microbacterium phage Nebulous]
MGKVNSFPTKKAQELEHGDVIIDPEGNEAHVIRYRWVDHQRGRLETDLGIKVVKHSDRFPLMP